MSSRGRRIAARNSSDPARYANYVSYFWEAFLDGMADSDNGSVLGFRLDANDKALFPELRRKTWVKIYEDSQGFVREV